MSVPQLEAYLVEDDERSSGSGESRGGFMRIMNRQHARQFNQAFQANQANRTSAPQGVGR